MKKKLLMAALAVCSLQTYGQKNEVGILYGNTFLTGKPTGIIQYGSFSSGIYYKRNFKITDKIQVSPGFIYNANKLNVNGYFSNNSDGKRFEQIPYRYNKSGVIMAGIKVPLTASYEFMKSDKGGWGKISSGVYGEYVLNGKQQYLVAYDGVIQEQFSTEKAIQAGINEEVSFSFVLNDNAQNHFVLSAGAFYQFTEYLNNNSSFKPLQFYLKLGLAF